MDKIRHVVNTYSSDKIITAYISLNVRDMKIFRNTAAGLDFTEKFKKNKNLDSGLSWSTYIKA